MRQAGDRHQRRRGGARGLLVAAALVLCPTPARAQEFHEHVRHWCQDYWMVPRREILQCLQRDYAEADAELNRVYRAKMSALPADRRQALLTSQRAWLRRYDEVLTSYYSKPWANHSIVQVLPSQILAVRDRTAYLRALKPRE
ncbi:MAG: DUF1311 domain-containing protein [Gemmatimonadetes bacterium]|nr:DUF1311 domain-containing protein [Gemmatimonadota bacterium]